MGDVLHCRSGIDEESEWMMAAGNAVFAALVFAICQRRFFPILNRAAELLPFLSKKILSTPLGFDFA